MFQSSIHAPGNNESLFLRNICHSFGSCGAIHRRTLGCPRALRQSRMKLLWPPLLGNRTNQSRPSTRQLMNRTSQSHPSTRRRWNRTNNPSPHPLVTAHCFAMRREKESHFGRWRGCNAETQRMVGCHAATTSRQSWSIVSRSICSTVQCKVVLIGGTIRKISMA